MMIQNYDRCYQVIRCLEDTEDTTEYLCRELKRRKGELCLLVCVREPVLARQFTLFLEERIQTEEFTDYQECFRADGKLYAVFRYSPEQSLAVRLAGERLSLFERAQIARGVLERLLLQNPHPFFAGSGLRPAQITVSRSLEVGWNYHLEDIRQFDKFSTKDAALCLAQALTLLFADEREKLLYPELDAYLAGLELGQMGTYMEMYGSFLPVCEMLKAEKEGTRVPQTFWFRLWEKIKKMLGFVRKLLMTLLLIGAMLYVVYVFLDDKGSRTGSQVMKQIGDLVIEQQER